MSSPAVLQKLEELRTQKKKEDNSFENEEKQRIEDYKKSLKEYEENLNEMKIVWEAEILFRFDSIQKKDILNGFSSDKTMDQYITDLFYKYQFYYTKIENLDTVLKNNLLSILQSKINGTAQRTQRVSHEIYNSLTKNCKSVMLKRTFYFGGGRGGYSESSYLQDFNLDIGLGRIYAPGKTTNVGEQIYYTLNIYEITTNDILNQKTKIQEQNLKYNLVRDFFYTILLPVQNQRDDERRKKEAEIQAQKDAEILQRRIQAFQDFEKLATNSCTYTTYKPIKNVDYTKNYSIDVLKKQSDYWYYQKIAYTVFKDGADAGPGDGKKEFTPEMMDWYDKGLIPFCTRCPVCQAKTIWNYVTVRQCVANIGGWNDFPRGTFEEVYCPSSHYFYNSRNNTHYVSGGKEYIKINRGNPGHLSKFICWEPEGRGWKVWDPEDPDGSKEREREKQKEKQDLQNQIALLQQKLQGL